MYLILPLNYFRQNLLIIWFFTLKKFCKKKKMESTQLAACRCDQPSVIFGHVREMPRLLLFGSNNGRDFFRFFTIFPVKFYIKLR